MRTKKSRLSVELGRQHLEMAEMGDVEDRFVLHGFLDLPGATNDVGEGRQGTAGGLDARGAGRRAGKGRPLERAAEGDLGAAWQIRRKYRKRVETQGDELVAVAGDGTRPLSSPQM